MSSGRLAFGGADVIAPRSPPRGPGGATCVRLLDDGDARMGGCAWTGACVPCLRCRRSSLPLRSSGSLRCRVVSPGSTWSSLRDRGVGAPRGVLRRRPRLDPGQGGVRGGLYGTSGCQASVADPGAPDDRRAGDRAGRVVDEPRGRRDAVPVAPGRDILGRAVCEASMAGFRRVAADGCVWP